MTRIIRAQIVVFIGCFLFAGTLWAYGGGSGTTSACKKPKFSDFNPVHLAEVAPESGFSFVTNEHADLSGLTVTVKKTPVTVEAVTKGRGLMVTGQLPEGLAGSYARIAITAKSISGCKGQGGWLVKITGGDESTAAP
ncbi:MAG: hypothetical protein ABGX69_01890 [Methylococcales bacterium]